MTDRDALPFARLELIDDPAPRPAALNMALDEVLLEGIGVAPLLRIYRWERPAVSFGYFGCVEDAAREWPDREMVRRWTGGGIVAHGQDLTFSLLVPRSSPLAAMRPAESYRRIHAAVASALADAGHPGGVLQSAAPVGDADAPHACFKNPVRHDLLLADRKVAGGAQRRTRRGLLHQGSIQLAVPGQRVPGAGNPEPLAAFLPRAFGTVLEARGLAAGEIEAATALAATKYGNATWLRRM